MKIAQVCPYDIHRAGGVQAHILDTSRALEDLGHEVRVIAPGPKPRGRKSGFGAVEVIYLGHQRPIDFNDTRFEVSIARGKEKNAIEDVLRREAFDVMHFHTVWTPLLPFQILKRSRTVNVATFHDTPPRTLSGRLTRILFRILSQYLVRKLDAVIAPSPSPAKHLAKVKGKPIHILAPAVNFRKYTKVHKPFGKFRDGKINILFLSRLETRKGIYVLLDAFRKLQDDGLAVRLLVAGGGDAEAVKKRARALKLKDVEFLSFVEEKDKARWYATCDIFCAPALYGESFGIVLVEAMASGKPVVAADNSGFASVLKGKGRALLCAAGDPDALYEKLKRLAEDKGLRKEMGAWGKKEAMKHDARTVAAELVKIYEKALQVRRKD